jgi:general secretion pathway protein F
LVPLSVVREEATTGVRIQSRRRIGTTELAVLTRQFATLVGSGLTVEETLHGLIDQSEIHHTKAILTGIRSLVMEGQSLAIALRSFPRSFSELYVASVAAGEQTGRLAEVLERLADYTEASNSLRQRITTALVYPIILTVVAIAIVAGLVTYVVPQVVQVFTDTGQTLPVLTRMLIAFSDAVRQYGLWVAGIGLLSLLIGIALFRRPGPKYALHKTFLMTPGLRQLARGINASRMARTLAIMVGSGVPLLAAMRASTNVLGNRVMRRAVERATEEVTEGASLSRAIGKSGRFPPLLTQMVASGESSGRLAQMLDKSAQAMERELESRLTMLVGMFEPLMILLMGGMVFTIVLAILLPIFDLNELIK